MEEGGADEVEMEGLEFVEADIVAALSASKNKTPAADDIRIKLLKFCSCPRLHKALARLFTMLASSTQPLPEWMRTGTGTVLFKKGDRDDAANYRLIVMGSLLPKLYDKCLEQKGWKLINEGIIPIHDEQGGFRPKFGTEEQVFLLQTLRAGQTQRKQKLYTAFLDIRKAFDTVNHKKLLRVLHEKGAPANYIQAIRNMLFDRKV